MPTEADTCRKFTVPALQRAGWEDDTKLPAGTEILKERGRLAHPSKITSTGKLIIDTLSVAKMENPNTAERHRLPRRPVHSVHIRHMRLSERAHPVAAVCNRHAHPLEMVPHVIFQSQKGGQADAG